MQNDISVGDKWDMYSQKQSVLLIFFVSETLNNYLVLCTVIMLIWIAYISL